MGPALAEGGMGRKNGRRLRRGGTGPQRMRCGRGMGTMGLAHRRGRTPSSFLGDCRGPLWASSRHTWRNCHKGDFRLGGRVEVRGLIVCIARRGSWRGRRGGDRHICLHPGHRAVWWVGLLILGRWACHLRWLGLGDCSGREVRSGRHPCLTLCRCWMRRGQAGFFLQAFSWRGGASEGV